MREKVRGIAVVIASVWVVGCTPPSRNVTVEPDLPWQSRQAEGSPLGITRLFQSHAQTVNVIRITGRVAMHVHKESEETVYIISGSGVLHLRDFDREVKEGDLVVVPRNTPHGFTPHGEEAVVALSIFSPRFQQGDRIDLEPLPRHSRESGNPGH